MMDFANIPLFEGLSKVDVARLIPELEEVSLKAGELLFRSGDPGDALYIVRAGRVGAEVDGPDGVTLLSAMGPGSTFGEVSLLTGERRVADVRALENSVLLRLSRAQFETLVVRFPHIGIYLNRLLGERLAQTTRHLNEAKARVGALSDIALNHLPPSARHVAIRTAPWCSIDCDIARRIAGDEGPSGLQYLIDAGAVEPLTGERYAPTPVLRAWSVSQYAERGMLLRNWADEVALSSEQVADWPNVVEARLCAGNWGKAARTLQAHWAELHSSVGAKRMVDWVQRVVQTGGAEVKTAVALCLSGGHLAQSQGLSHEALLFYADALQKADAHDLRREKAEAAKGLAEHYAGAGQPTMAEHYARIGLDAIAGSVRHSVNASAASLDTALEHAAARVELESPVSAALRMPFVLCLSLIAGYFATRYGLTVESVSDHAILLGILASASVLWASGMVPDFAVGLAACAAVILTGAAPESSAMAGFSSGTFFVTVAILTLAALLTKTGLAYRAALVGMRLFPPTYRGQTLLLSFSGLASTALLPDQDGRLSLVGSLILGIKDTLRLPDQSRGAQALAMAAWIGYGQMSFLFLTGTKICLILWAMMPDAARATATWGSWFLAALPMALVVFFGGVAAHAVLYRPEGTGAVSREVLHKQVAALGKVDRMEKLGLAAMLLMLAAYLLQPWHQANPAWIGLILLFGLFAANVHSGVIRTLDWGFLLYMGSFLSLSGVVASSGLGAPLAELAAPTLEPLASSPLMLLTGLALITLLLCALFPSLPNEPMLMLLCIQIGERLGIHPLVFALVIVANAFPNILGKGPVGGPLLAVATEGRAFTLRQMRPLAAVHIGLVLIGVMLSVPYWRMLGLLP